MAEFCLVKGEVTVEGDPENCVVKEVTAHKDNKGLMSVEIFWIKLQSDGSYQFVFKDQPWLAAFQACSFRPESITVSASRGVGKKQAHPRMVDLNCRLIVGGDPVTAPRLIIQSANVTEDKHVKPLKDTFNNNRENHGHILDLGIGSTDTAN